MNTRGRTSTAQGDTSNCQESISHQVYCYDALFMAHLIPQMHSHKGTVYGTLNPSHAFS